MGGVRTPAERGLREHSDTIAYEKVRKSVETQRDGGPVSGFGPDSALSPVAAAGIEIKTGA